MYESNNLLNIFENNKNKIFSIYELSRYSGTLIFNIPKKISKLRKEGYKIASVGRMKYVLEDDSDVISKEGIILNLDDIKGEFDIKIFKTIDSTNSYAKSIANDAKDKTVIIANSQTDGRGRLGRSFYSPADNGIYMSVILKKSKLPTDITLLTVATATAVSKAIEKSLNIDTEIKWVNDIFINKKKACGILAETAGESIIIGIGINVKSTDGFPEEIKDIAGALNASSAVRNTLIAAILKELYLLSDAESLKKSLEYYKKKSMVLNKTICYEKNGCSFKAKVKDINDSGNLVVENENGEISVICSGEIRLGINNIS